MNKTLLTTGLIAASLGFAGAAVAGKAPVNNAAATEGSAASAGTAAQAVFQSLGVSGTALYQTVQSLPGSSVDPTTGAVDSPVVFIEGFGDAIITVYPDGRVEVRKAGGR